MATDALLAYNEFNLKNMKIGGYFYAWCEKARLPELRVWIFIAQESIRGFVFFYCRETSHWRIESVVGVVVITLADLTQQDRATSWFNRKIVIQPLLDKDTFARS